jgi:predicted dehydrogenase
VEESVFFMLHFPGGTIVHASSSYGVHESRRYRCLADKGGWLGMDPAFPYKGLQIEVSQVVDNEVFKKLPVIEEKDQFALEIDHMSQCILNNEEPKTPGEEGLRDQLIMEAIYESAETGKAVYLADKSKLLWPVF